MKKFIYIFFIGLFLVSCTNDLLEETQKQTPEPLQKKADKVADAINFINDVFVEDTIESVAPVAKPKPKVNFKKANIDTIYDLPDEKNNPFLKLVVFKPKAYAVVSAIKNVPNPPVLYYSPDKFDVKNPNPGLVTYLQEFIANSIRYGDMAPEDPEDEDGDGFRDDGSGRVGGPRYSVYSYKRVLRSRQNITEEVNPLLTTYWGQKKAYNNTLQKIKCKDYHLGCVPVAMGQIIAYHKKAHKYYNWGKIHGKNLDYKLYGDTKTSEISRFLYDIAVGTHTFFSTSSSSTLFYFARIAFVKMGYTAISRSYDYQTVVNELKAGRPVYLRGNRSRWLWGIFSFMYYNGHAWVADGYKVVDTYADVEHMKIGGKYSTVLSSTVITTKVSTTKYLHMNWGWGSYYNDWVTYDYWKAKDTQNNYKYNKKMLLIRP